MSDIDHRLAESEKQIAEIQRQAHRLLDAARARPSGVAAEDLALMDRLLAGWRIHREAIWRHPEFRERALDLALKRATGRDLES
jgi:hypothetical protein